MEFLRYFWFKRPKEEGRGKTDKLKFCQKYTVRFKRHFKAANPFTFHSPLLSLSLFALSRGV